MLVVVVVLVLVVVVLVLVLVTFVVRRGGSRAWYVTRAHAHEAKNQSERDQTDRVLCNSFLRSTAI